MRCILVHNVVACMSITGCWETALSLEKLSNCSSAITDRCTQWQWRWQWGAGILLAHNLYIKQLHCFILYVSRPNERVDPQIHVYSESGSPKDVHRQIKNFQICNPNPKCNLSLRERVCTRYSSQWNPSCHGTILGMLKVSVKTHC